MLPVKVKNNATTVSGCVIWMHGLGADGNDMAGVAAWNSIARLPLRHIFIDAPIRPVTLNAGRSMRAWYDILGFKLTDKIDKAGILQSEAQILEVVDSQLSDGFEAQQIVLAGFSQGGAMALHTALRCDRPLAGVIALSAALPIALEGVPALAKDTPFFIAGGQFDQVVLPEWTKQSRRWLLTNGYSQLTVKEYPVEHTICQEEMDDIAHWLSIHLRGVVTA